MKIYVNLLASYEGEPEGGSSAPAAPPAPEGNSGFSGGNNPSTPPSPPAPRAPAPVSGSGSGGSGGSGDDRVFTQDEVNAFLADDRRKHQEKYKSLEVSYQDLLKNQNLTKDERDRLNKELEDLQARHRTKEQQIAYERKQEQEKYETELSTYKEQATTWKTRFTESTIQRALQEAAVKHEAYNPQQVIVQLKGQTELVEAKDSKGQLTGELVPMVTMTVKNEETGVSEPLRMTPDEAVEYMKKNPSQWGNFFKNNIREGIGSANATGGAFTGSGNVDHSRLSDEQWFKLRKENPAALGLDYRRG